jgi:hypothetical protein
VADHEPSDHEWRVEIYPREDYGVINSLDNVEGRVLACGRSVTFLIGVCTSDTKSSHMVRLPPDRSNSSNLYIN